jgi:hypothetical protein
MCLQLIDATMSKGVQEVVDLLDRKLKSSKGAEHNLWRAGDPKVADLALTEAEFEAKLERVLLSVSYVCFLHGAVTYYSWLLVSSDGQWCATVNNYCLHLQCGR